MYRKEQLLRCYHVPDGHKHQALDGSRVHVPIASDDEPVLWAIVLHVDLDADKQDPGISRDGRHLVLNVSS